MLREEAYKDLLGPKDYKEDNDKVVKVKASQASFSSNQKGGNFSRISHQGLPFKRAREKESWIFKYNKRDLINKVMHWVCNFCGFYFLIFYN